MAALSSLLREVFHLSDSGTVEHVADEAVRVRDDSILAALSAGQVVTPLRVMKTERLRLKQPRIQVVRRKVRRR